MSAAPAAPAPTATPAAETPAAGRSRRWPLLLLAAVVAVAVGAGAAAFLGAGGAGADPAAEPSTPPPVQEGQIVDVGTLTTNLSGQGAHYARVGVAVVLAEGVDPATVEADLPLVKDAVITEISRHDAAGLRGAEGVQALRGSLTDAVVGLFEEGQVLRVALTELLVQ